MSSGPVITMVLARERAISYWRELIGPTNTIKARQTHPDWWVSHCEKVENAYYFYRQEKQINAAKVALTFNVNYLRNFMVCHICSLRAIYGTDDQRNGLHGSDSYSSAAREIRFFFPDSK